MSDTFTTSDGTSIAYTHPPAPKPGAPRIALVVMGEEDYATPFSMARQLHEAIAQSTLTIVPLARHLAPIERPEQIASELRGLLMRRVAWA